MTGTLSSLANKDLLRQTKFWEKQAPHLALEFLNGFQGAIDTIALAPEGYRLLDRDRNIRKYVEQRFHTVIVYRFIESEERIRVLRIYDGRMNPQEFLESLDRL